MSTDLPRAGRAAHRGGRSPQAGQGFPGAVLPASRGSPEGRFLAGPGKPLNRQIAELKDQRAAATVRGKESQAALERAESMGEERKVQHRGGDRPWPLRLLILLAILAEGVTAFVAMEVLVGARCWPSGLPCWRPWSVPGWLASSPTAA